MIAELVLMDGGKKGIYSENRFRVICHGLEYRILEKTNKKKNKKTSEVCGLSYQKNAFPYINKGKTQVKQVGPGTTSLVLYVLALHCPLSLKCRH